MNAQHSEEVFHEKFRRKTKLILNKLTPENFTECLAELSSLFSVAQSVEVVDDFITEIYAMAIAQQPYASLYAKLIAKLNSMAVARSHCESLNSLILRKCRETFETPIEQIEQMIEIDLRERAAKCPSQKLSAPLLQSIELKQEKARQHFCGNLQFLCELFNVRVVAAEIIQNEVLPTLLASMNNDSIKGLHTVMITCGSLLQKCERTRTNQIVERCRQASTAAESTRLGLDTKHRFMLMEIFELRDRYWALSTNQKIRFIVPKKRQR